jgi:hypothetical protein
MPMLRALFRTAAFAVGLLLTAIVVAILAPLWIFAALVRWLGRALEPRFLTRNQLLEFDPALGWKWKPDLRTHHLVNDLYTLTTDADGWPGWANLESSDVVVFGDSFAAGYGVNAKDTFANVARPRIKPIAVGGYSMVQELLCMRQLAGSLRGKHVVWLVFHGNDLYDNLVPDLRGYRKPFVREAKDRSGWEIVSSHVQAARWPIVTEDRMQGRNHLPRLADLCADTFVAKRAFAACEFLIAEGRQLCREAGADLTVMTVPEAIQLTPVGRAQLKALGGRLASFDAGSPDARLEAICRQLDVNFVAGSTFLDGACYRDDDCHWNERGHKRMAAAIGRLRRQRRTFVSNERVDRVVGERAVFTPQ